MKRELIVRVKRESRDAAKGTLSERAEDIN